MVAPAPLHEAVKSVREPGVGEDDCTERDESGDRLPDDPEYLAASLLAAATLALKLC